jgi:hypothetical protein
MIGRYVASDLELSSLSKCLPLKTKWGQDLFTKQLLDPTADVPTLKRRQFPLLALRNPAFSHILPQLQTELEGITPLQDVLNDACMPPTERDPRIQEGFQQILWTPESPFAWLNATPRVLHGLVTWKSIVLPGISILMPLLAILVPFVFLRFLRGPEQVSTSQYLQHVRQMFLNQMTIPPILRAKHSGDVFGYILETLFIGITIATFVSGMWNQVRAAMHLRTLSTDVWKRGSALATTVQACRRMIHLLQDCPLRFQKALKEVLTEGEAIAKEVESLPEDFHAVFGTLWNTPAPLCRLRDWIARMDVYCSIACIPGICFPRYTGTVLDIRQVRHPLVEGGIPNDGHFTSHVLLTGPNRGGKSTFCKSVGVAILCAQTWGFAWASSFVFKPFTAIETALSPADELGRMSLFESEIEFAKEVLARCEKESNTFVMMDEIFHSTNAHDGVAASRVFLDQLYAKANTTTLISTHYRELVEVYKEKGLLAWAMDATETPEGLQYSYRVTPGISDKSSVMEILRERGLVKTP